MVGSEGLLEILGLKMMVESVRAGMHLESWWERIPDCRSCNAVGNMCVCVVRMYKCSAMASNCGGCRRTNPVYQCGWDAANNRCCAFDECAGPSWLSPDDICTNPALFSVCRHCMCNRIRILFVKVIVTCTCEPYGSMVVDLQRGCDVHELVD